VYRLFSDFPLALPGLGLLLLRVVLAVFLLIDGATRTAGAFDASVPSAGRIAYGVALIVLGIPVALGFLSPIVHVMVAVVESASMAAGLALLTDGHWQITVLQIGIALALAMIGPGAYSIDSRLFGRREIVIRPRLTQARHGGPSPTRK
jgi:uncharacterized membrane protein YphA (DoxX/SURF4 family)